MRWWCAHPLDDVRAATIAAAKAPGLPRCLCSIALLLFSLPSPNLAHTSRIWSSQHPPHFVGRQYVCEGDLGAADCVCDLRRSGVGGDEGRHCALQGPGAPTRCRASSRVRDPQEKQDHGCMHHCAAAQRLR